MYYPGELEQDRKKIEECIGFVKIYVGKFDNEVISSAYSALSSLCFYARVASDNGDLIDRILNHNSMKSNRKYINKIKVDRNDS
jgi:hypothetical protein